jgi:hypothetical protein
MQCIASLGFSFWQLEHTFLSLLSSFIIASYVALQESTMNIVKNGLSNVSILWALLYLD